MSQHCRAPMLAPIIRHRVLDNSVACYEVENLPYGCSGFERDLREGMGSRSIAELERSYPELVFGRALKGNRPKGHAFVENNGAGWTYADWRRPEGETLHVERVVGNGANGRAA